MAIGRVAKYHKNAYSSMSKRTALPLCVLLCGRRGLCGRPLAPPSLPVQRVRRAVDHHAGQEKRDDQPQHATGDKVGNGTDNGGDDHPYGHEPEQLTRAHSEPPVRRVSSGLGHDSPPRGQPLKSTRRPALRATQRASAGSASRQSAGGCTLVTTTSCVSRAAALHAIDLAL